MMGEVRCVDGPVSVCWSWAEGMWEQPGVGSQPDWTLLGVLVSTHVPCDWTGAGSEDRVRGFDLEPNQMERFLARWF